MTLEHRVARSPATGPRVAMFRVAITAVLAAMLCGCDALRLGVANAAGPIADAQWHVYKVLAVVLIFVAGPVLLLTPLFAWRYRLANKHNVYRPRWIFSWWIEGLIWIPPTAIVIGLSVLLWQSTHDLDPYRPIASDRPALEVQAVALDWKWLFIYPEQGVATINQLAIPVDRPVHIVLTSGTVMQSMLIAQLAGQIYAMAHMRTELNLSASRPGTYTGRNVQYNGTGFSKQRFDVIALPEARFGGWLQHVATTGHPLDEVAYRHLFEQSVQAEPVYFSSVPQSLFEQVLDGDRSTTSKAKP